MIIDSSAIFAVVLQEPDAEIILQKLFSAPRLLISAATMVEIAAVATRRFSGQLDATIAHVLATIAPTVIDVTSAQADIASAAYRRYGIGTKHPAELNFGDCFAYALAMDTGDPLLFKGDDFTHTDVRVAR